MEHVKKKTIYGLNVCKCAIKVASAKCVCDVLLWMWWLKEWNIGVLLGFLNFVYSVQDFKWQMKWLGLYKFY